MSYISPLSSITEGNYWGDVVKHQYPEAVWTNNSITIITGQAALLKQGTLLGKITASGKYTPVDPDAVDGSEVAAAILYTDDVDAVSADATAVVLIRGPAVISFGKLTLVNDLDAGEITTAKSELAAIQIISGDEI